MDLSDFSALSILLPLLVGFINLIYLNTELRILLLFLLMASLFELITTMFAHWGIPNLASVHLYTILELVLLGAVYKEAFVKKIWQNVVYLTIYSFVLMAVFNTLFLENINSYPSNARSVESILLITFGIGWFYQLINSFSIRVLWALPMFWINSGILLYFAGNLFLFVAGNYLLKQPGDFVANAFSIHSILIIIRNLLFSVGLWMKPQT